MATTDVFLEDVIRVKRIHPHRTGEIYHGLRAAERQRHHSSLGGVLPFNLPPKKKPGGEVSLPRS